MLELIRTTVRRPQELLKPAKIRAIDDKATPQDVITEALRQYLKKGGRK